MIIDLVDAGMTFGETRAFRDDPHYHFSCAALRDAELVAVDFPAFVAVLHDSAETCLLLLRRIAERAEHQVDDIDRLALQGGACRVASYLLGQLRPGRSEFVLTVPKGVLATRLGLRCLGLSFVHDVSESRAGLSAPSRQAPVRLPRSAWCPRAG